MIIDRPTIKEAKSRIERGRYDVVIVEDLSRIYRHPGGQFSFVYHCVDNETRLICLNDDLDTADENWESSLSFASVRHSMPIPDTRKRVRRTATFAFHRGGMVTKVIFGYRKLTKQEADSGDFGTKGLRIAKDPKATAVIREMCNQVLSGRSYEQVAAWLNEKDIRPSHYTQRNTWNGRLVVDLLRNELLHGERLFRKYVSTMIFRSGKSRRSRNSSDKVEREIYLELAHLSETEHAELLTYMDRRASMLRHNHGPDHPLYRKPRSRTYFPRQHITCGICGSLMYPVDRDRLVCSRSREEECWNRVSPRESLVRTVTLDAILNHAQSYAGFEAKLLEVVKLELARLQQESGSHSNELERKLKDVANQIRLVTNAIAASNGALPSLLEKLRELESAKSGLASELNRASAEREDGLLSTSDEEISGRLPEILHYIASSSSEFAEAMPDLVPDICVVPVQALDTPAVYARVRIKFPPSTIPVMGPHAEWATIDGGIEKETNAFEAPQHVRDALVLLSAGAWQDALAANPKEHGLSNMRAMRARDYIKLMMEAGIKTPYRELTAPPENASRWRKSKSRRRLEDGPESHDLLLSSGG